MAIQKVLTLDVAGNQRLQDIGVDTSTGAADAGKAVVLKIDGTIDSTMLPTGSSGASLMMTTSEALNGGDFINIWDDAGAFKVRKTDATTQGKPANGFVIDSAGSGVLVKVHFDGINTAVSGVSAGSVFLSTTAGGFTSVVPSATGNVSQRLGTGISATSIDVKMATPVLLA